MPEDLFSFENLYKAHLAARRGKRHKKDVIAFEMDLAHSIWNLKNRIDSGRYKIHNYNTFNVYEPKKREIQAVKYSHRVVMHCLCDNYLTPLLEKRLIYDNAACRKGKGTHFSLRRLKKFFCEHYKQYGNEGYILKMDICKYFPSINREILIGKLRKIIEDEGILEMMEMIISSWNGEEGKGLPMGNQTSQWFALYYLDEVDRLIKEKLAIKYYVRYMDDMVIIHHDRGYLKEILRQVRLLCRNLKLELNAKTQISPIKNGVDYLGWQFYLADIGRVIMRLKRSSRVRIRRRMRGRIKRESVVATWGHLKHGDSWNFWKRCLG